MSRRSSGPSDPPKNYTRNGSRGLVNIILTILLIFFNITTLITAILTAIAAGRFTRPVIGGEEFRFNTEIAQDLCPTPCFTVQSVVSFISWLAISLLFVSVIRMGTRHGHRLARYIFRVVLTILIVLVAARILVPACEGLTTFCDVADWFIVANL